MTTTKASTWSLTINNPTADDEECINIARQKGWKVDGQKEVGENGTPHYQLILKTGQVRFSAVKKTFPRAHIEVARNVKALETYVHKEETREGELLQQNEFYPSLAKFWMLVFNYFNVREKYGLDQDESQEGLYVMYDRRDIDDQKIRLQMLDEAVNHLIRNGYHVESIGINPATRSSFSRYMTSIFDRCRKEFKQNELTNENANVEKADLSEEANQSSQA